MKRGVIWGNYDWKSSLPTTGVEGGKRHGVILRKGGGGGLFLVEETVKGRPAAVKAQLLP